MPKPLGDLNPFLDILAKNIKILPATGGAVEELQHPDREEVEDAIINKEVELVDTFAEDPVPDSKNFYRPTPALSRGEKHFFRFFLDGSIYTYFLGTGIEGSRSFPIELAQIGSTVVQRKDNGHLQILAHKQRILLLLPKQNQGVSDTLWSEIKNLPKPEFLEIVDFSLPDILSNTKKDPRDKAGAKARSEMHKLEIELIKSTDSLRNNNSWLIIDGAVKFVEADIWNTWGTTPNIIGVAKSFRKDPLFQLGGKSSKRKDITDILAGLPHAHRTAAFSAFGGQVAFWYVRLREQKELDYPLMGVVKVELPRPDKSPVPADLVNLISRALVAERNVTPYGLDQRWHCSLYPIHVAEKVIKNRFFSREVLMGCIKWQRR